jgi:hypothetical protein
VIDSGEALISKGSGQPTMKSSLLDGGKTR